MWNSSSNPYCNPVSTLVLQSRELGHRGVQGGSSRADIQNQASSHREATVLRTLSCRGRGTYYLEGTRQRFPNASFIEPPG